MTDLNKHHVTCPQKRRVNNRRIEQSKWRRSKEWKALVEAHAHVPEAVCVHCGKKHGQLRKRKRKDGKPVMVYLTINHLSRRLYATKESYCTWNEILMEIACTVCNWMYEKGKKICPVCKEAYIHCLEPDNMCITCWNKLNVKEA